MIRYLQFFVNRVLKKSSGFDGGLDGRADLNAGVIVTELSQALKHIDGGNGSHQVVNGGNSNLVDFSNVGECLVQDGPGDSRVCSAELVQADNNQCALEIGHGQLTFEIRFKNGKDFRVCHVSKSPDVNQNFRTVLLLDCFLKLGAEVGNVFLSNDFIVGGSKTSEGMHGVTVVNGFAVYLSHADEFGEGVDSRCIEVLLFHNLLVLDEFLKNIHIDIIKLLHYKSGMISHLLTKNCFI